MLIGTFLGGDLVASGTAEIFCHADLINALRNQRSGVAHPPGSSTDGAK